MATGNIWDNSSILLSNQSGANMARGIEQVGQAFSKGVQGYFERKQRTEKEEATVDWINQNDQATNALFPQLANVKDPAERRKVIKAGIKGAGLENLVQVQGFMEQQRQRQAESLRQDEMLKLQKEEADRRGKEMERRAFAEQQDRFALQWASGPGAALHDQIIRGVPAAQLDPNAEVDRAALYLSEGGNSPQMVQALTKSRPFLPAEFMTPSGLNMVQTSPNSFIPDPRVRNSNPGEEIYTGGPEYSSDKRFFRSGPRDKWKPIRADKADEVIAPDGQPISKTLAKTIGWTEENGWGEGGALKKPIDSTPATAAPAGGAPVQVKSKAERDALPAGTAYIGPDGKTYIKK